MDDDGVSGGIGPGASFVIAGDFNADPLDGDSVENAIGQLLHANWIDSDCVPVSKGADEAALIQGGLNSEQQGDPAADTADFNDKFTGNLRLDYLLPSSRACRSPAAVFSGRRWARQAMNGWKSPTTAWSGWISPCE